MLLYSSIVRQSFAKALSKSSKEVWQRGSALVLVIDFTKKMFWKFCDSIFAVWKLLEEWDCKVPRTVWEILQGESFPSAGLKRYSLYILCSITQTCSSLKIWHTWSSYCWKWSGLAWFIVAYTCSFCSCA